MSRVLLLMSKGRPRGRPFLSAAALFSIFQSRVRFHRHKGNLDYSQSIERPPILDRSNGRQSNDRARQICPGLAKYSFRSDNAVPILEGQIVLMLRRMIRIRLSRRLKGTRNTARYPTSLSNINPTTAGRSRTALAACAVGQ